MRRKELDTTFFSKLLLLIENIWDYKFNGTSGGSLEKILIHTKLVNELIT